MFPQLIAGPIVRYSDIERQLVYRKHTLSGAALGIRRFVLGLAKKVIFANNLGKLCSIFQESSDLSVLYYWLFRDYVYIPMGGNRVKRSRWFLNIGVVWCLTGLWHGASWNFVVWGLMFAALLMVEKAGFSHLLERSRIFSHIYVLLMVMISFVIFNAADLGESLEYLKVMFTGGGLPFISQECSYYLKSYETILFWAVIGATPGPRQLVEAFRKRKAGEKILQILEPLFLAGVLIIITGFLVNDSYNPFLYFRF